MQKNHFLLLKKLKNTESALGTCSIVRPVMPNDMTININNNAIEHWTLTLKGWSMANR